MSRRRLLPFALLALVVVVVEVGGRVGLPEWIGGAPPAGMEADASAMGGGDLLAELFREERSGVWVEATARVERLLPDDREGEPHQRLVVSLPTGQTLLVTHNLDLAPRVPAAVGDTLGIRGRYEWNDQGGVLHWTHHDPARRRPGGWIRLEGKVYR